MTRVTEVALGEREDLGGRDREHEGRPPTWVLKAAVVHLELPLPVPLSGPCHGEAFEHVIISDLDRVALDHDVESFFPVVASGRQNHVRVPTQVHGLLFSSAGGKVESAIKPHGNQWRDVGATVGSDRRDPEQLGSSSARRVSSHPVATASGSLKRGSIFVTGSFIKSTPFDRWGMGGKRERRVF